MYLKFLRTWLFISYLCIIIYLTLTPANDIIFFMNLWRYDKIVHFTEYLGVGFLLINMLKIKPLTPQHWKYAIIFLLIFPVIDEFVQYFSPSRIPDVFDAFADICGGFLGAYIRKII